MAHELPFDPLVDLDGLWTPELAEQYLPIPGAPPARHEARNGKLIMSPRAGSASSWAAMELGVRLRVPARTAGHAVYAVLTVQLDPKTWIEPDLVVLVEPVADLTWVPAGMVLMPVEFVSPSAKLRDRIHKPGLAADAGIPYYLRVEINRPVKGAELHLLELTDGAYRPVASALAGERFRIERPFELDFDPAELLEP